MINSAEKAWRHEFSPVIFAPNNFITVATFLFVQDACKIKLLEYPIPPTTTAPRQMAISQEPSVVSEIRWCQKDWKKSE